MTPGHGDAVEMVADHHSPAPRARRRAATRVLPELRLGTNAISLPGSWRTSDLLPPRGDLLLFYFNANKLRGSR